jgi:hypothetical protein
LAGHVEWAEEIRNGDKLLFGRFKGNHNVDDKWEDNKANVMELY